MVGLEEELINYILSIRINGNVKEQEGRRVEVVQVDSFEASLLSTMGYGIFSGPPSALPANRREARRSKGGLDPMHKD